MLTFGGGPTYAATSSAISDGVLYVGSATGFTAYDLPSGTAMPSRPSVVELVPDRSLKP